jgi:hypothetical protein
MYTKTALAYLAALIMAFVGHFIFIESTGFCFLVKRVASTSSTSLVACQLDPLTGKFLTTRRGDRRHETFPAEVVQQNLVSDTPTLLLFEF